MKHRYILFDVYEWDYMSELTKDYIIGRANTKQEIRKIWKEYASECDGECTIWIYDTERKDFVDYEIIK